jgi:L-ascorbate metabolism protein UlaG (beta-lactamase superfamily)
MSIHHMDPQAAVALWQQLGMPRAIPIHWGVFELTDESLDEPVRELSQTLRALSLPGDNFQPLRIGQYLSI